METKITYEEFPMDYDDERQSERESTISDSEDEDAEESYHLTGYEGEIRTEGIDKVLDRLRDDE